MRAGDLKPFGNRASCTLSRFRIFTCSVVGYTEFKTTEDVKSSRWSFTKGVEYSDLTGNKWYVGKVACHIERTHGITKHKQTIL